MLGARDTRVIKTPTVKKKKKRPPLFADKGTMAMGAPAALNPELNGVFREDFLEGVASELSET